MIVIESNFAKPFTIAASVPEMLATAGDTLTVSVVLISTHTFPTESIAAITGAGESAKSFSFMKGGAVTTANAVGAPGTTVNSNMSVSSTG
jgi:hypothetical protein